MQAGDGRWKSDGSARGGRRIDGCGFSRQQLKGGRALGRWGAAGEGERDG